MKQEEKELLFKDLCARLPYKPFVQTSKGDNAVLFSIENCDNDQYICNTSKGHELIEHTKPYLRSVYTMTEKEMDNLFDILHVDKRGEDEDWIKINDVMGIKFFLPSGRWMEEMDKALSYLRSIHIDIHSLIGDKIALEAPEGMYKIE